MMDNHRAPAMNTRRNRNSILQTAGDALGFRMNKRKRVSTISNHGQSHSYGDSHSKLGPSIFDDVVLEISANGNGFNPPPTVPEYVEDDSAERERLRDAAAQAVGLPQANTNFYGSPSYPMTNGLSQYGDSTTTMEHAPAPARMLSSGKTKSGATKSTSTHSSGSALPRYPGTLSSMQSYVQNGANLLKYYSSASPFLILSRSRQWKTRHIVLTSTFLQNPRRTESHLHLFKSSASDDRELERMRIHTGSVVYVADEEVGGGRQFILKIGGIAVDAGSKDVGPASWLLQMPDSAQMQRWIQIVKNAVLLQKAERDGPITDVYHNMYGRQERKSDTDMPSSTKQRQSFAPVPSALPMANTLDSVDTSNNGTQPNGAPTGLGPVSALKGLWNNRPTSRQLSISGSSIATAFATPSLNSQASVHPSLTNTPLSPLPPTPISPAETEQGTPETVPSKSRESTLYNIFRPTSPQANMHQQQPSITQMSPPISPTVSSPYTEDALTSPSSTIGTRFSPNGSGRHTHHSSSFSVDWDAIDINGNSLAGLNSKRSNPVIMQPALAPPPRRRPLTGGGLSQRQPSPPKEVVEEEHEPKMSPSPAASVPLQLQSLEPESRRSFDGYHEENADVTMETALRGQGGQRSYFDDEDEDEMHDNGMAQEVIMDRPPPLNMSPMSAHSHGHDDNEVESQRSAHLPSPLQRSNLPLSSASSFGANGSVRTAIHEQGSLGMGFGQSSSLSLHSESRDDSIMEEDHRDGVEHEGGDSVNQFHLPTGARRRSRLSSIPRQLSPPLGPLPPVPMPMFHSPPFTAVSPPSHEYSSSERPGSSSSIPSTVPSLHTGGMPPLLSKRISTMSSSDAPSIKSIESSGGGSMNSKLVGGGSFAMSNRLSAIPGPSGPRSAFPPPRPAPNVAPPPAPLDDLGTVGGHHRLSLSTKVSPGSPLNRASGSGSASSRSEFVQRTGRYSMGPAGPPPTAALPPTPLVMADPDFNTSSVDRYSQALPRSSLSSFSSNGHSNITSTLFTIPASPATSKPPPDSSLPLPAMAPLPIRPLPPTPGLFSANDAEHRPVSPDAVSTTSNRSSRSTSALPFTRMSSFKLRLRMMSSPTPVTGGDGSGTQSLVVIPPAQPPPNFPLPDIPYHSRQTRSQSQSQVIGYQDASGMSDQSHLPSHLHSFSPSPPITPLGEAIMSRLETHPFSGGASAGHTSPNLNGTPSTLSSSAANSPAGTVAFGPRALRNVMPPTSPPDMTPLSPPPRRNSRASRDLTPSERERWKVVVAGLKDEENGKGPVVTPYESVPAKHSAINLLSFTD